MGPHAAREPPVWHAWYRCKSLTSIRTFSFKDLFDRMHHQQHLFLLFNFIRWPNSRCFNRDLIILLLVEFCRQYFDLETIRESDSKAKFTFLKHLPNQVVSIKILLPFMRALRISVSQRKAFFTMIWNWSYFHRLTFFKLTYPSKVKVILLYMLRAEHFCLID
jgi:hypothetical protein